MENIQSLIDVIRRLENLIRVGHVFAVDTEKRLCRVKSGDLETNWIKWICHRAGDDVDWWPPTVGEQVLLFSLSGELTTAFALLGDLFG